MLPTKKMDSASKPKSVFYAKINQMKSNGMLKSKAMPKKKMADNPMD